MYLIFDTETTGLPKRWDAPFTDTDNWPRAVQIAWQLHDRMGNLVEHQDFLIAPDDFNIPYDAEIVHGISTELAQSKGVPIQVVFEKFNDALKKSQYVVGQNIGFDINIMGAEFLRYGVESPLTTMPILDTCTEITAELCKIPGGRGGRFKLPTLTELHEFLFGIPFAEAHNATADVEATTRCFFELIRIEQGFSKEFITPEYVSDFQKHNPTEIQPIGLKHINLKEASDKIRQSQKTEGGLTEQQIEANIALLEDAPFAHLHNHTQFSVLQSTTSISDLVKKTAQEKMPAVALTDSGNMMAAFHFVKEVAGYNKSAEAKNKQAIENGEQPTEITIKPIVGCEFNVCEDHLDKSHQDNGYQIVILAKNKKGYHNLAKMASIAYTQGYYYVPRIDKKIVEQYKSDLMVLSGGMNGEISSKVLNIGQKQAEDALLWWKEQFGEDFYIEIMRHGQEDENRVNITLIELAKKHHVKLIATNNTFYINQKDANAHDILLCVKDNEKQATPIGRGRGYRFGMPNEEYYYKSTEEMKALFKDLPEAILNISEVISKVEPYGLGRDVLLPKFDIPVEFTVEDDPDGKKGENNYLRHLTYVGAEKKYKQGITDEIRERLDFELSIIEKTGYPGYFLIVQDFIAAARNMGVSVGPGRGSAAGSAVAYCLGITNMDPIEYDLLFERFLNPDRVSMPDIDIDFEDSGRQLVIDYVINKYGANQVARIITYGTMAAKSSIKDTARVLAVPIEESNRLAGLVPDKMPSLKKIFNADDKTLKEKIRSEDFPKVNELKQLLEGDDLSSQTIQQARVLEGSVRNTGVHACGVIITPDDITNFVPISLAKDSDLFVTQFDNSVVESAGLLKMDFLGLSTLTLIKDTVEIIKLRQGIDLDPEEFPLDDKKTYELFQRGETVGIFQYESLGMQKYMKELKPTVFADLIAMNALYRPGPLEYIPSFIRRKHGTEPIVYDLEAMEEYLKETYGITVYQEQVMLLSQKLAGFTKGDADTLRKAMGKKQKDVLDKMKPKFISQAAERGHDPEKLEKIWRDWEAFASYAFNKSHSTCYAWIGYQTAFLKANYPAEFMAAVLSNNMNDIKQVTFFLEECKRMGIKVLSPDVNESFYKFTVNKNGDIRFGLGAIKGVGRNAVDTIVEHRKEGMYTSIFDVAKRVDYKNINKKAFENIALAGGFDSFTKVHRAQYFHAEADGIPFLEKAIRFGSKYQESKNSAQMSLFGGSSEVDVPEPIVPNCETWGNLEQLRREKEVIGIYISGHPLDEFKHVIRQYCNLSLNQLSDLKPFVNREVNVAGMITDVKHNTAKNGKGWASFIMEDYDGAYEFRLFNEDYLKFRNYLIPSTFLFCKFKVEEGWVKKDTNERGEPRIKFMEMIMMQDVLQKMTKKVAFEFGVNDISEHTVHFFKENIAKFSGNCPVIYRIKSAEEKISISMDNPNQGVHISNDFLDALDKEKIRYLLNEREPKKLIDTKEDSKTVETEEEEEIHESLVDDND